jgi:hypothetical protein
MFKWLYALKERIMKKKPNVVKKVLSHLKEDKKEFKEQIADDNKLAKKLKGKKK